jgi:hypothetical protein
MERRQLIRRLRIAVSVFFAGLTVLLCVLWVRSYWTDSILTLGISPGPGFMVGSANGEISVAKFRRIEGSVSRGLSVWENEPDGRRAWEGSPSKETLGIRHGSFFVAAHFSIAVTLTAAISAASLVRWRFSLRTLFFGTTVVAAALGLGIWLAG